MNTPTDRQDDEVQGFGELDNLSVDLSKAGIGVTPPDPGFHLHEPRFSGLPIVPPLGAAPAKAYI